MLVWPGIFCGAQGIDIKWTFTNCFKFDLSWRIRDPTTVIMGSPGLLRAARNKLIAVERSKEEVILLVIMLAMLMMIFIMIFFNFVQNDIQGGVMKHSLSRSKFSHF